MNYESFIHRLTSFYYVSRLLGRDEVNACISYRDSDFAEKWKISSADFIHYLCWVNRLTKKKSCITHAIIETEKKAYKIPFRSSNNQFRESVISELNELARTQDLKVYFRLTKVDCEEMIEKLLSRWRNTEKLRTYSNLKSPDDQESEILEILNKEHQESKNELIYFPEGITTRSSILIVLLLWESLGFIKIGSINPKETSLNQINPYCPRIKILDLKGLNEFYDEKPINFVDIKGDLVGIDGNLLLKKETNSWKLWDFIEGYNINDWESWEEVFEIIDNNRPRETTELRKKDWLKINNAVNQINEKFSKSYKTAKNLLETKINKGVRRLI